jgi:hypothetical protein
MGRMLVRRLLQCTAILCALGILPLVVALVQGSTEAYPTGEQEGKLRIAAGLLLALLAVAGGLSLLALKRLKPGGHRGTQSDARR